MIPALAFAALTMTAPAHPVAQPFPLSAIKLTGGPEDIVADERCQ